MPYQQIDPTKVPDLYGQYCRQDIVDRLKAVCLDAVYTRASGDRVWWQQEDGLPVEVLDMAGGYGATLFGHNHQELVAEAKRLLDEEVPVLVQASIRSGAGLLAQKLSELVGGDYVTIFTNSGTEAVEAAMKHAILERQGVENPVILAVIDAFHGKTLGAIQATQHYREPFVGWGLPVRFLDPADPEDWQKAQEETAGRVIAAFIEPIQGEGGIRPLPANFLQWLSEKCRAENIPLVADEIQTGMGRTGTFLASHQMGLEPDYVLLSKALGGGLVKIGALLIKRSRFIPEFALKHTSTFAEDDLSCRVALKALKILKRDNLPGRCAEAGRDLLSKLEKVKESFPGAIREVRGKGLMIGIQLTDQSNSRSNILKMVSDSGNLGWLAAAYLLNVHHIRIAPTLSNPFTLRVEPLAYITDADIDRFVGAIRALAEALEWADVAHLTGFLVGVTPKLKRKVYPLPNRQPPRKQQIKKVAFIGHYLSSGNVVEFDPYIEGVPLAKLQDLIQRTRLILRPTIFDQWNISSPTGDEVHLSFIGVSVTAQQIVQMMRSRNIPEITRIREQVNEAVALAKDEGCLVVGIGAYLPKVTNNCRTIACPEGIVLTSGNSLTVGMGIAATKEAARRRNIALKDAHLAVVGAPGNIASTYAILMAPLVSKLTLLSRHTSSSSLALARLVEQICTANPKIDPHVSDNPAALDECSVIVTASTSGGGLIQPEHLSDGPVVILDISRPYDVSLSVREECPNAHIIQGGVVRLPCNDDFSISGISVPPGHSLPCMAETILKGLDGSMEHRIGQVTPEGVEDAMAMAARHGFQLSALQTTRS